VPDKENQEKSLRFSKTQEFFLCFFWIYEIKTISL